MPRYAFQHHDLDTFVIRAKNKKAAIRLFTKKVSGKFGFWNNLKLSDVKDDISQMNIVVSKVTEV